MKTTTLYFQDDRSDKVYVATLDGKMVRLAWGRRGSALQTKTVGPLEEAEALYEVKLKEKLAKGYRPSQNGTALVDTRDAASPSPTVPAPKPQLLNEITGDELVRLCKQPEFWLQQKFDGNRILLRKRDGKVSGFSRTGRETTVLPEPIVEAAARIPVNNFLLDGELIGDAICAFDLLEVGPVDWRPAAYSIRFGALAQLCSDAAPGILVVPTAKTCEQKSAMIDAIRAAGGEGLVLKRSDATYSPGRPNSGGPALKFKFVATASVIVAAHHPVHRSVTMKLADGTLVGNVTIPPNHDVPAIGAVIEVRYLYAHRGGSLFQSVYLGVRDDVEVGDCTIEQLKFKNEAYAAA